VNWVISLASIQSEWKICISSQSNTIPLAYGFAPASTIAPLGTTTLISNVVMAPLILRETFRLQGLIGVLFAIFGASTVVFSSKSEELAVGALIT
jgi:uncharacterized membrane protein